MRKTQNRKFKASSRTLRSNGGISRHKTRGFLRAPHVRNDAERGNALIFILIAIALLGAITAMLTRSGSSTGETGNYEQTRIIASKILRFSKGVGLAVDQLRQRGCSENEISFEDVDANYANASAPVDKSCHVFNVVGGGVSLIATDADWFETGGFANHDQWLFDGRNEVEDIGTNTRAELTIMLGSLKKNLCLEINRQLGIPNPSNEAPTDDNVSYASHLPATYFTGTYTNGVGGIGDVAGAADLAGKQTGCVKELAAGTGTIDMYHFYHVLIIR